MTANSIDGIYGVFVTGKSGNGLIMLIMSKGIITGVDPSGVLFDGEYYVDIDNDRYHARVSVKIPPKRMTVQGVNTGPSGFTYEVSYVLPGNFASLEFLEIQTQLGAVNAKFRKLRPLSHD